MYSINQTNLLKMNSVVVVLQGELTVCENPVVKLIAYDGHIIQRKLGENSVRLNGVRQITFSGSVIPVTVYRTEQTACLSL